MFLIDFPSSSSSVKTVLRREFIWFYFTNEHEMRCLIRRYSAIIGIEKEKRVNNLKYVAYIVEKLMY